MCSLPSFPSQLAGARARALFNVNAFAQRRACPLCMYGEHAMCTRTHTPQQLSACSVRAAYNTP